MRHSILATGILTFLWLVSGAAYCQTIADSTNKPSVTARHQYAVGIRYSTFGDRESSLSGKYFFRPQSALHLTVGKFEGGLNSPSVAVFYERYHSLFRSEHLRYLYSVGMNAIFPSVRGETRLDNTDFFAGVTVGVEYLIRPIPVAIGVDFRQMFLLNQSYSRPVENHNLAISAHYYFK
jgi:hypothetical protein